MEQVEENQIIGAFMNSFGGDTVPAESTQAPQPSKDGAQVEGADAPTGEAEAPGDSTDPKSAEPGADKEQESDVQTIEIDPEEPLFEQELDEDGKKVKQKLSLKELQLGYLRTQDYHRKTEELARQREEVPKLIAKQGKELSESYGKRLAELNQLVLKTVAQELQGKDLNTLANEDAFEWVRVSNRIRQVNELLQTIRTEMESEKAKRDEEDQKAKAERWQKSHGILQKDIPQFGPDVVKRLIDAGEEWGFTKDEVSQWDDHRLIKMLHALSDKKALEAKRPEVEKKVAVVTKFVKPGTKTQTKSAIAEAQAKLRKSGRMEDALPIFESFVR